VFNFFANLEKGNTLQARLTKAGYPICISNRTDPFCMANYKNTVKILETLTEMGIQFCLQTKGGNGIDEVLEFTGPCCWYFTIESLDDDLMKKISPNAPLPSERLEMVKKIIAKGHSVRVGINPTVPEWVGDIDTLLKTLADIGVYGCTLQALHINSYQIGRMTENEKTLLKPHIGKSKKHKKEIHDYLRDFNSRLEKYGLVGGVYNGTDFAAIWEPYKRIYKKTMPLLSDFFWWAVRNKKHGDIITFRDFAEHVGKVPKCGIFAYKDYITANRKKNIQLFSGGKDTFDGLLQTVWANPDNKMNPVQYDHFSFVISRMEDSYILDDVYGLPTMMFLDKSETYCVYENGEKYL
jgi:DNA repair photolyase